MQINKVLIAVILLVAAHSAALAQGTTAKGVANAVLEGPLTPDVKVQAVREAGINALDRYFSGTNQAKAKNYELIRDDIINNIDQYVLSVSVLSEDIDGKSLEEAGEVTAGLYTVVVRADLNLNRLNNELKSQSVVANTAAADKSYLTMLFVARQQTSVQSFDDKVYKRTDVNAQVDVSGNRSNSITESESIGSTAVTLSDSQEMSGRANFDSTVAVTSGGSTTAKADIVKWDLMTTSEMDAVMEGVFTNAGYEVVPAVYLEEYSNGFLDINAIRDDYKTGDDLAPATLRNTAKGVQIAEVPYLALGTLDVGMQETDPATGLVQVFVTVTGKVLDVSGRFPKTASSVGPVQIAGLGPNATVARTNALSKAAETAAKQLSDELNAKGFH